MLLQGHRRARLPPRQGRRDRSLGAAHAARVDTRTAGRDLTRRNLTGGPASRGHADHHVRPLDPSAVGWALLFAFALAACGGAAAPAQTPGSRHDAPTHAHPGARRPGRRWRDRHGPGHRWRRIGLGWERRGRDPDPRRPEREPPVRRRDVRQARAGARQPAHRQRPARPSRRERRRHGQRRPPLVERRRAVHPARPRRDRQGRERRRPSVSRSSRARARATSPASTSPS